MKEIKKIRKEIDDLEWSIRNDVVDEDEITDIRKKIADKKQLIETMLESLPGMK